MKIQNVETIQYYFTRVSQIKEHLEVVDEEVENAEIVMTTLNGLPRTWDTFIQGICARKKLVKFSRLWEECSQEEARIVAWEEKMGSEDQALIVLILKLLFIVLLLRTFWIHVKVLDKVVVEVFLKIINHFYMVCLNTIQFIPTIK